MAYVSICLTDSSANDGGRHCLQELFELKHHSGALCQRITRIQGPLRVAAESLLSLIVGSQARTFACTGLHLRWVVNILCTFFLRDLHR